VSAGVGVTLPKNIANDNQTKKSGVNQLHLSKMMGFINGGGGLEKDLIMTDVF